MHADVEHGLHRELETALGLSGAGSPAWPGKGKVLLTMRRTWRDGTRAILFEPNELIERLAALIPKPRINLLLYHGVFGPAAKRDSGDET